MRLIDVHSMEMREYMTPPRDYAILSHTWGDQEVSLTDFLHGGSHTREMNGLKKIQHTCEQAKKNQIPYVWIDTCCIDKNSSSELSEAINSMYKWYQTATVCYVYLEDVKAITGDALEFCQSRWFKRGWTLQELVAPRFIEFYGRGWTYLGSKIDLLSMIASASGIFETVLQRPVLLHSTSVAARMSWASNRQTTREEDQAYILLGIFDVNMPLLYGEGGHKAFLRLQEQIIKNSDDESLLAWGQRYRSSLLAPSPRCFKGMKDVFPSKINSEFSPTTMFHEPFSLTNRGLKIELPVIDRASNWDQEGPFYAVLSCCRLSVPNRYLMIPIKKTGRGGKNEFEMDDKHELDYTPKEGSFSRNDYQTIYISSGLNNFQRADVYTCSIATDIKFKFSPVLNSSFTYWDNRRSSITHAAATILLPNQKKVTIQFSATLISDPRISFLGIVEWDIMLNMTYVHAIVKQSDSWLKDHMEATTDIYGINQASPQPNSSNNGALAMCWRSNDQNNVFLVFFIATSNACIAIQGNKVHRTSSYFSCLEKLVDESPFKLTSIYQEVPPEHKPLHKLFEDDQTSDIWIENALHNLATVQTSESD